MQVSLRLGPVFTQYANSVYAAALNSYASQFDEEYRRPSNKEWMTSAWTSEERAQDKIEFEVTFASHPLQERIQKGWYTAVLFRRSAGIKMFCLTHFACTKWKFLCCSNSFCVFQEAYLFPS